MPTGNVKWFDVKKGFGFIVGPEGQDVFVHFSQIDGDGFRAMGERFAKQTPHGRKSDRLASAEQVRPRVAFTPGGIGNDFDRGAFVAGVGTGRIVVCTPTTETRDRLPGGRPVTVGRVIEVARTTVGNHRAGEPPPDARARAPRRLPTAQRRPPTPAVGWRPGPVAPPPQRSGWPVARPMPAAPGSPAWPG